MAETWYLLEDGTVVHPDEVAPDAGGALVHQSGVAVAMRGDVPSTCSVYDDARPDKRTAEASPEGRGKRGYKTRKEA